MPCSIREDSKHLANDAAAGHEMLITKNLASLTMVSKLARSLVRRLQQITFYPILLFCVTDYFLALSAAPTLLL